MGISLRLPFFGQQEVIYELRAQLWTDAETQPIEDASVEWPIEQSHYRTVSILKLPVQDAYRPARQRYFDDEMTFRPGNSLLAHQPLGSVMRGCEQILLPAITQSEQDPAMKASTIGDNVERLQVARSSYYDATTAIVDDTALVKQMHAIQAELPAYGYPRIAAQLRDDGILVNRKRARLMRLHGLQVRPRRRYVATTDSDHDGPIFQNLAKDMAPDGPEQL